MNEFFKLWATFHEDGKRNEVETYLKDMDTVQRTIKRYSRRYGSITGHISKYTDQYSAYLMDLDFGENGFIEFEAENVGVQITWNPEQNK